MSELSEFVLNFYQVHGAIVEPPRYGVYEVLLPEALAAQLEVPAFQQLVFDEIGPATDDGKLYLTRGHPLIDRLVELARRTSAPDQVYINAVRLDKHSLADLARQALALPNARLVEAPRQIETRLLSHYVQFSFKVTMTSDEKREQLASVVMDAQAGWPVVWQAIQERATLEPASDFAELPAAAPRWIQESNPLAPAALTGLLERARCAVLEDLSSSIEGLRRRLDHFLELDRARLEQYYDDLARDLERRLVRAEDDRRASLQDKLASVRRERELKLADAEARYQLRIDPELITAQVIAQPKLYAQVQIENRNTSIQRTVVYDPLLHRIEPLMCDVCGRPGYEMQLCSGGHLAHAECLLVEQCGDCKRIYCRLCEAQMGKCAVCGRPTCLKSLNMCNQCGRGTCREHKELCHAAQGEPAPAGAPASSKAQAKASKGRLAASPRGQTGSQPAPKGKRSAREQVRTHARERPAPVPRTAATQIVVEVDWSEPVVTAFVLSSKKRELAVRTWQLTASGISKKCECEKGLLCPATGVLIQPGSVSTIDSWMQRQVEELRREYGVPASGVSYVSVVHGAPTGMTALSLRGKWKDESFLKQARQGFDHYLALQNRSPRRR